LQSTWAVNAASGARSIRRIKSGSPTEFYDSIIGSKNLFLVKEFVTDGRISSLVEKITKFPWLDVLCEFHCLCENRIIRHDIAPGGILVIADRYLKLTDFLLRALRIVDRRLAANSATAPDIILGQLHSFNFDEWSLGVLSSAHLSICSVDFSIGPVEGLE
jgi:hypothetical protein